MTKQPSKLCECFFIKKSKPGAKSAQSLPFYLTIFICRGFKSFRSVKIMKKHPWFYTKNFRLKSMKKARKYGLLRVSIHLVSPIWLRELDLNQRPSGYEPDELPNCSIPRYFTAILPLSPECLFIISQMNVNVNTFFAIFLFWLKTLDYCIQIGYNIYVVGVWRRLVARYLGVVEVVGSNPVTPTNM